MRFGVKSWSTANYITELHIGPKSKAVGITKTVISKIARVFVVSKQNKEPSNEKIMIVS